MPEAAAPVRVPGTKGECQRILRRFGFTGLKVDTIGEPVAQPIDLPDGTRRQGAVVVPVYVFTGKRLQANGAFARRARTVVFSFTDHQVHADDFDGWWVP